MPPIPEAGKLRDPLSAGNPPGPRRSAAAGAGVYTGDVLTQPLPQGAQTQGTVVVAKVTTPIWFDFFFSLSPLNNITDFLSA